MLFTRNAAGRSDRPRARRTLSSAVSPVLAGAMALACSAGSAWAQGQAPRPSGEPERPILMIVATAGLISIMLVAAAFFPSKRGHQD